MINTLKWAIISLVLGFLSFLVVTVDIMPIKGFGMLVFFVAVFMTLHHTLRTFNNNDSTDSEKNDCYAYIATLVWLAVSPLVYTVVFHVAGVL